MQRVAKFIAALGLIGATTPACSVEDQVLQPDPLDDAGRPIGDGDEAPGDGDFGDGDGDYDGDSGDGDNTPGDEDGDSGDGDDTTPPVAAAADCDLNGIWIGRQSTTNKALGLPQIANNWYYLEFEQRGTDVLVKKHYDCGIVVKGSVTVVVSRASGVALMQHNNQAGRKGTLAKVGNQCEFSMDRYWSIRGANEARYRPSGADAALDVAAVAAKNPLPTKNNLDGAEDWDKDGTPGTAWQSTGIVSGTRHSIQRDWNEWFTDSAIVITPSTTWPNDFVARTRFNNEEVVIDATHDILKQASMPDNTVKNSITLRLLGRDANDARVKTVMKSDPYDTCLAIQQSLPMLTSL